MQHGGDDAVIRICGEARDDLFQCCVHGGGGIGAAPDVRIVGIVASAVHHCLRPFPQIGLVDVRQAEHDAERQGGARGGKPVEQISMALRDEAVDQRIHDAAEFRHPARADHARAQRRLLKLSIEDRFAIQDLFARYSWALDTGDTDALAATFTELGEVREEVFETPDVWRGRDAIRALGAHFAQSPFFPGRQHHVSMPLYTPHAPDRCGVRSFVYVTECRGEPPYKLRFAGYYIDEVVRHDGEWLLDSRIIRLWDGEVLSRFPGRGEWVPRKRPADLVVKR